MKQYDTAVVVERFQIPHKAHIDLINYAYSMADNVLIIIGSVNSPRTIKNPFTFTERSDMIRKSFSAWYDYGVDLGKSLKFRGIEDKRYNNNQWLTNMRMIVDTAAKGKTGVVGHHKDDSSFYLDMFPEYNYSEFHNVDDLNSTYIRNAYFGNGDVAEDLPSQVQDFLTDFKALEEYETLVEEYQFIGKYKDQWSVAPYPVTFNTTDAVVMCMAASIP
jgi:bifunctional NMN adenylyltransferase/nudix hydrolase